MAIFGAPVYMQGLGRTQPSFPNETAVMDFNGDGHLDLFTAWFYFPLSEASQTITIHLGNGDGTFRDGTTTIVPKALPTTVHPRELVLRDFNGDGRTDIYIADHGYDLPPFPGYQDQLLLSGAAWTWRDATSLLPQRADFTHSATAADVDGDGDIDIFQGNLADGDGPAILLNNGSGRFTIGADRLPDFVALPDAADPTTYATSEFADFDGDGDQDLFLGQFQADASVILLNDGTGKFTPSTRALPPGPFGADTTLVDSQARDLNGDGRMDLVVLGHRFDGSGRAVQVLMNKGGGRFADETAERMSVNWAGDNWVIYLHFADLNGDGFDDMITQPSGGNVEVLLNNGDGYFFEPPDNELFVPGTFELGDFNGDGKIDVINFGGGQMEFRPGTGQVPIRLKGTERNDKLFGDGFGNRLDGAGGNDVIRSGARNDDVTGGTGADKLYGGTGNDVLRGAAGVDRLQGDSGADRFFFSHAGLANADTVVDFRHGIDKIVLDASRFSGTFADISYRADGKLFFDGQLVATLVGHPTLTASDVLFL
ncbi:MAG: repeat protein [Ramlibacter sp.]|jgi:Ca2+-binding RTX toxin-like protein|nr:repeat protein [Ramlibacter sp.]